MIIPVETYADVVTVSERVQALWEMKGPQEVEIRNPTKDRSKAQNRLYWKWLQIIANKVGSTKEEQADVYKELYLIGIYVDDEVQKYLDLQKSMLTIRQNVPERDYDFLKRQIIRHITTTDATVKQMTEYLNKIKHHAQSFLGIQLPLPEQQGLI